MAIADLTTWTELDPGDDLTVTATSITAVGLVRSSSSGVWHDYGAGVINGDFTFRLKLTTPASGDSQDASWIYPLIIHEYTSFKDGQELETDNIEATGFIFLNSSGAARLPIFKTEGTARTTAYPDNLAWETTYYITFERDDNGGANGTGQSTLRIYTVNYYGETGAVEHDTVTIDSAAGYGLDGRIVELMTPRGDVGASQTTNFLIEDFDPDPSVSFTELSGTIAATTAVSGDISIATASELSGTIAAETALTGVLTVSSFPVGAVSATRSTRRLIAFANNQLYYEDI